MSSEFSDSFDDSFARQLISKPVGGSLDDLEMVEETSVGGEGRDDSEKDSMKDDESDDSDFQKRAKNVFKSYGKAFIEDVLPKLPTMPNEMILLGCHERSPLHECGELFKMRVFRPDRPIKWSEAFDDGTVMRFTNIARLMNDDMMVFRFKIEAAALKVGVIEQDMTGLRATPGLLELEDVCNLTIRPFMERKVKGKFFGTYQRTENFNLELVSMVLEIQVLKKLNEDEMREMKEACATTYGAKCVNTDKICALCLIREDVREITMLFEQRDHKTDDSKLHIIWI